MISKRPKEDTGDMKLLVANRGEIAVRVFRAARDTGMKSVAIYAEEDQFGGHVSIADESCMIGSHAQYSPSEAYLQSEEIVRIAIAKQVQLVHPGYGYLSENAGFAKAVRQAGIKFVGPPTDVIAQMGDKVKARALAKQCGIPIIPGTDGPIRDIKQAFAFAAEHSYPVMIKASSGGGGRGMRVVHSQDALEESIISASKEALSAFGDGSVFLEKFLSRPKHLEVQVLGDGAGNVIHLFERDCTVQRKYQKIIELAPAPSISSQIRASILDAALRLAKHVKYENAGTVEFLVDGDKFYFIEMNPRIQVEHTVTEQITGIDLVQAQLKIANGATLPELGLYQDQIKTRGVSIQCRVTTEVPAQDFRPSTGTLELFKTPSGPGVRVDSAALGQGSIVKLHYDPMLLKCITHGSDMIEAVRIMLRALDELKIKGVETNVTFLEDILQCAEFLEGECWTTFLQDFSQSASARRGVHVDVSGKLLHFLGYTAVNGTQVIGQTKPPARLAALKARPLPQPVKGPATDTSVPCQIGWRNILLTKGPAAFAQAVRNHGHTLITDTTWRDGQQSLLATRVRTRDFMEVATQTSHAFSKAYSLECWGGATFDVAYRFLYEDPWERLRQLRRLVPNVPFQMLLRSTNGLAYSALPDNAIYHFVRLAKENGMDIFRVFDSLNNIDNLEVGIRAALAAGAVAEGAIMYTGDVQESIKYTLEYYMDLVDKLVGLGVHVIAIKSMSGVMKPSAGRLLVQTIRQKYPSMPIHMHTHDNNGTGVATMVACAEAGADIVDGAIDSISGTTSQPALAAIVASLQHTPFASELRLGDIAVIDAYWAQLRLMYAGFDADLRSPDCTVYDHEIPGGQYSNLMFQARQLGLGSQWEQTKTAYTNANILLGDIIKATPTSKAVGDLAQFMVDKKLSPEDVKAQAGKLDFPGSVIDFFEGSMGIPHDGFVEPLRTNALRGKAASSWIRPGLTLKPVDFDAVLKELQNRYPNRSLTQCDVSSYIMFPDVYADYCKFQESFGDVSSIPTEILFTQPEIGETITVKGEHGKDLIVTLLAMGRTDEATGKREVFFRLNGELRCVYVTDKEARPLLKREQANLADPADLGSPMAGNVSRIFVKEGDHVKEGDSVVMITAMKMEIKVSAKISGVVSHIAIAAGDLLEKDDLLIRVDASAPNQIS